MSKQSQEIQDHVMIVNMEARNLSKTKLRGRLLASKYRVKQGSSFQVKVHCGSNYSRLSESREIGGLPLPFKELSLEDRSLDQGNPLHLHPNNSNYASIISLKLTGVDNYRIWASAMKLALQIKHKIGFINGTCDRSAYLASALLLEQWDRCNAVVLNWILSSLFQDVYLGHVFYDNTANVWNELKETYDRVDDSIVFNLLQKINTLKQGGLPVSEYYHKLNSLWREFDILTK
ncbi:ribonuclease H-like domain-containing protein, partial [Tanacetum coccineum]